MKKSWRLLFALGFKEVISLQMHPFSHIAYVIAILCLWNYIFILKCYCYCEIRLLLWNVIVFVKYCYCEMLLFFWWNYTVIVKCYCKVLLWYAIVIVKLNTFILAVIVKWNAALIPVVIQLMTIKTQEGSVVVNVLKCCWWNIKFLCCQQKVSSFKFKLWNSTFHSQARASHLFPQSFIRRHFHLKFRIFHRI